DKPRARELFTNIVKPALEPRTCEDALVYDVDDFYQTLQQVLAAGFTPAEREKDEQVQFLTLYLSRITAHAELAPAARIVAGQGLTPAQLQVAEGAFLARLESMPSDDRSFSVAVAPLEQSVFMLAQSLSSAGLATDGLVGGFRKYLTANLSGARCGDNAGAMTRTSEPAKVVEWFNSQFHGDTPEIKNDEIQASSTGAVAKVDRYWESGDAKQILMAGKALRFDPQGRPLSDAARNTREWKSGLSDFLQEMESWKPTAEPSEADFFHQKAIVYEALLELTPSGGEHDKILNGYVTFLASSDLQQEQPVEWFCHAYSTLERLRNTNAGQPGNLLAAFQGSGNAVLSLYAGLEQILPSKPYYAR
ncbi:MAG: hypothetical protein ABI165_01580, partial [Bryobacteraceae bacterium]